MKSQFKAMIEHVGENDFEELRDVLAMMGEEIDLQDKKIKQLEKKVKRVNAQFPSTATKRGR